MARRGNAGYRMVKVDGRRLYEHRYVMELVLGRPLRRDEHVHHINGDKRDNRPENLEIVSAQEHVELHHTGRSLKPELRERIVALKANGLTVTQVAREVGLHQSTVTRHLQRAQGINCGRSRLRNLGGQ